MNNNEKKNIQPSGDKKREIIVKNITRSSRTKKDNYFFVKSINNLKGIRR